MAKFGKNPRPKHHQISSASNYCQHADEDERCTIVVANAHTQNATMVITAFNANATCVAVVCVGRPPNTAGPTPQLVIAPHLKVGRDFRIQHVVGYLVDGWLQTHSLCKLALQLQPCTNDPPLHTGPCGICDWSTVLLAQLPQLLVLLPLPLHHEALSLLLCGDLLRPVLRDIDYPMASRYIHGP